MKSRPFQDRVPPPELKEVMTHGNMASFRAMSLAEAARVMSQRHDRKFCAEDIRQIETTALRKCKSKFRKIGITI